MHSLLFYFILTIFHYLRFKDGNESNDKAAANGIKQSSGNSDEVGLIFCCMDPDENIVWDLIRILLYRNMFRLVLEIIYIRNND